MLTNIEEGEKRNPNKGGHNSIFETSSLQEINFSPYVNKSFEDTGCLRFCERVQEVGCDAQLISLFATIFRRDEANITGIEFTISADSIALAIVISNHGEIRLKGMDLDIENYNFF